MTSLPSAPLSAAIADEISSVSARGKSLFSRHATLSAAEQAEMHGLWEYEKRLGLIQGLLAIARPAPLSAPTQEIEEAFRNAVVKHGSATDDNVTAASAIFLRAEPHEVSLCVGRTGPPLGRLLLGACDVIGSAEFFSEELRQVPEFADVSPEAWESAYRVLMLAVDLLMACPRHPTLDSER